MKSKIAILFLAFLAFLAIVAQAQNQNSGVQISPLHSEFGRHARGQFQLTNQGFAPLNVNVEVVSIAIKNGRAEIATALDSGTHVKMSQYSAKIGAKQTHVFYYTMSCDSYPCSAILFADIAQGHTDSGEAVVLRLGSIVYACEKQKGCRDSIINAESSDLKAAK